MFNKGNPFVMFSHSRSHFVIPLAVSVFAHGIAPPAFATDVNNLPAYAFSSFRGLELDVNGIRLDLPIRQSLLAFNPDFRLRQAKWKDSQGNVVRKQSGIQTFAAGNIWNVRETVSITPVPWHSGQYIQRMKREVAIKPDDQKPTIEGFREAVIAKYGAPTHAGNTKSQLGFMPEKSETYLVYTVKEQRVTKVPCWEPGHPTFSPRTSTDDRIAHYQRVLAEIRNGNCDAILVHFYSVDKRYPKRIRRYGARVHDFRLEAEAFIEDIRQKRLATEQRQGSTAEGETRL